MKLFLHTLQRVRILNGDLEWTGTPAEFLTLEPDYPGLPTLSTAPAVLRYCTPEWSYVEDSNGTKHTNTFDCLPYCAKIADYLGAEPATIYAHVTLAKAILCANAPDGDSIPYAIDIREGPDDADPLVPHDGIWPIPLRQANGLAMDNILVSFSGGQAIGNYTHYAGLPLGQWYIDDADFARVLVEGEEKAVKLAQPVRFTVYRS